MTGGDDLLLSIGDFRSPPAVAVDPVEHPGWRGKRVLDVIASALLILLFVPVLLLVALAVKATSPGPVLFRQSRVGRGGRDFFILKFRTMDSDAEARLRADEDLRRRFLAGDHKLPIRNDPRVTRIGGLLRRSSLDELPQLFNVLAGDMSLVGPRPVVRTELVRDYDGFETSYLSLRPGLTGLWQVSGRSTVAFPARAHLDEQYLAACGPWTDVKILLRTPLVVVTGLGAD